MKQGIKRAISLAAVVLAATAGAAEPYPSHALRLIVPFAPGGTTDVVARAVAVKLTQALNQSVVVENRTGAGGSIGTDFVAKSPPDGYTLLLASSGPIAVNPSLYPKLPYDPLRDFAPVGMISASALVLVSGPASPLASVGEMISLARKDPGKYTYSTAGAGSAGHITAELFNSLAGIRTLHIPYKGSGPATLAVVSGEIAYTFTGQTLAWPMVAAGKLRALAVASTTRNPDHADVPTVSEAGVPGFEAYDWDAILAPAGTPDAVVQKLNATLATILADDDFKRTLAGQGIETRGGSPRELSAQMARDIEKWAGVIKNAHIRID